MATPAPAPATLPSSLTIGSVTKGMVVTGSNNKMAMINDSPGAKIYQLDHVDPIARRENAPVGLPVSKPVLFLGRDAEKSALLNALQSGRIVVLMADNGMGKTSLVSAVYDQLVAANPGRKVIYLNAEYKHGPELEFVVYDAFYNRPEGNVPDHTPMAAGLADDNALIIVDNLAVSGNDLGSLVDLAPKSSFVLITSSITTVDSTPVALRGLPDADAEALFEKKMQEALDDASRQDAIQICEMLKGVPDLIITVALRALLNQEGPADLLAELKSRGFDDAALASLTTAKLTPSQKKVLTFIAVAGEDSTVPAPLLAQLRNRFPDLDVDATVARLIELHLVQAHSPRYSLCGTLSTILDNAWDLTADRDQMLDIAINWLPAQQPSDAVEDSLPLMLRLMKNAAEREKWSEVVKLGRALERFLFYFTWWGAWGDVLNILLRAAKALGDRLLEGWAKHQLGTRALAEGALDIASSNLAEALKIRQSIHDGPGLEATQHNLQVLKALGGPLHGNGSGRSGTGGHPLAYGFFGFAGLLVLALAGYMVFRPTQSPPATQASVPPVAVTTSAPIIPSGTPTLTLTPTFTVTPTGTLTETATPTFTASPTDTAAAQVPSSAVVTGVDFLACRYGPGSVYLYYGLVALKGGAPVQVLGRYDTALGPWALVKYNPPFRPAQPLIPCWVSANYLKMDGDYAALPEVDPHIVFPIFNDPKFVPSRFSPPTITDASETGNLVTVSVEGVDLIYNNPNSTDRQDPNSAVFLVEFWICQKGKLMLDPQGIYFAYDSSQPTASGYAQAPDDGSCGQLPHGNAYLAHRDGYVGPVPFQITH
jgi:hypothetical protein